MKKRIPSFKVIIMKENTRQLQIFFFSPPLRFFALATLFFQTHQAAQQPLDNPEYASFAQENQLLYECSFWLESTPLRMFSVIFHGEESIVDNAKNEKKALEDQPNDYINFMGTFVFVRFLLTFFRGKIMRDNQQHSVFFEGFIKSLFIIYFFQIEKPLPYLMKNAIATFLLHTGIKILLKWLNPKDFKQLQQAKNESPYLLASILHLCCAILLTFFTHLIYGLFMLAFDLFDETRASFLRSGQIFLKNFLLFSSYWLAIFLAKKNLPGQLHSYH